MGLFKVERGLLTLDKEELRSVPSFRRILERDRGSEDDCDGRKKYMSLKQFKYVFFMHDNDSPIAKLSDKERHAKAIKLSELPVDFKVDVELRRAAADYVELLLDLSPSIKILLSLERGLSTADQVVNVLINAMQSALAKVPTEITSVEDTINNNALVEGLVSNVSTLISLSQSIPKAISSIEEIREKIKQERGEDTLRGARVKGNREDPGYIKEKFDKAEPEYDEDSPHSIRS